MTEAAAGRSDGGAWQSAKIVGIVRRTARIKSFVFALPRPFVHRPGQYVDLRLTAPDGYSARRSYSIASAPAASGTIELAIERLDDGEVSPFLHDVAEIGDDIELRGPLGGHFVWSVADGGPLLLIGGGSGVAPLMSMIRERQATGTDVACALLLSARSWDEALYRDELVELDGAQNGFTLVLTLTRELSPRSGDHGRRVDAALVADVAARLPAAPRYTFVCGSNAFANAAADGAVAAGIPVASIRTERYGG